MASFGHLAVGMLTGQLHGAGAVHHSRRRRYTAILLFAAFSILPDADLIVVSCGAHDWGAIGHRGASHSLVMALMLGVACGLFARRMGLPALRTAIAITATVGSHGLLDTIGENGRGIPLLWPLSDHRFMSPWRFLPDAPRVEDFLSRDGIVSLLSEFCYFLPLMAYVLWPRKRAGTAAQAAKAIPAATPAKAPAPLLTMVKGGRPDTPPLGIPATSEAGLAMENAENAQNADDADDQKPSLRSSG